MSKREKQSSVEPALGRAVLLFRLLAVVWMTVMVIISLVTDRDSRTAVVVGSLVLAVGGATWSFRHLVSGQRLSPRFLIIDSGIAAVIAISPQLADAADAFYGGYPMSTVVVVAASLGVGWGLGAAGFLVVTQTAAFVLGARSAPSAADLVSLTVMATIVTLVVSLGFELVRTAERRRVRAEEELADERRRHEVEAARLAERVALADDLHDSLLQTVRVMGTQAADPDRIRTLARRQERELVEMIGRMQGNIHSGAEEIRVVVVSASSRKSDVHALVRAGAIGYLTKGAHGDEFADQVVATASGQAVFSREFAAWMGEVVDEAAIAPFPLRLVVSPSLRYHRSMIDPAMFLTTPPFSKSRLWCSPGASNASAEASSC